MRKSLRFLTACLIAALFSIAAFAQSITIRGTVRDAVTKEPVPAVSVIIKGSSAGDYTDDNGNFSIITTVKLPLPLVLTSVGGYEMQEVYVTDASGNIEFDFTPVSTLGCVVVVAATLTTQLILETPVTIQRLGGHSLRNSPQTNYYDAIANLKG